LASAPERLIGTRNVKGGRSQVATHIDGYASTGCVVSDPSSNCPIGGSSYGQSFRDLWLAPKCAATRTPEVNLDQPHRGWPPIIRTRLLGTLSTNSMGSSPGVGAGRQRAANLTSGSACELAGPSGSNRTSSSPPGSFGVIPGRGTVSELPPECQGVPWDANKCARWGTRGARHVVELPFGAGIGT